MTEAKNVTEAIAAIMAELPGIGKDQHASPSQGGYGYRGIEAITGALQPLLAKYGVVLFPRGEITQIREITVNDKPWTDTVVAVEYEISHGPSDTSKIVRVPGIGRDNSDKGSNKGMTQAFKYALLQTFCISDPKDDNDGEHHEADAGTTNRSYSSNTGNKATEAQVNMIRAQFRNLDMTARDMQIAYVQSVVGEKPIASLLDLSKAEASAVINLQKSDLDK